MILGQGKVSDFSGEDYEIIDYKCNVEKHINKILNLYNKFDF